MCASVSTSGTIHVIKRTFNTRFSPSLVISWGFLFNATVAEGFRRWSAKPTTAVRIRPVAHEYQKDYRPSGVKQAQMVEGCYSL